MRLILIAIAFIATSSLLFAQENINLELISNVSVGEAGSDIWGYYDEDADLEYAIMGTFTSTRIFSLEDPANPIERALIPGDASTWRDIKVFGKYAYVTADSGDDGLLIIDLTEAPGNITHRFWRPDLAQEENDTLLLDRCHNIYIDDRGIGYITGCRMWLGGNNNRGIGAGGPILLDLTTDPLNPSVISYADRQYSHDVMVQDEIMYASDINAGVFSIWDVSDPTNPTFLVDQETSGRFTHNAWVSHDGNYVFTTDENDFGYVDAYDISDYDNIEFLDSYRPIETIDQRVIPHNTHYLDGYLYTSWYTDGIIVLDAHRPNNLVKVAQYDTFLNEEGIGANDRWFQGNWGATPFLPSGLLLVSDINSGLYIFQADLIRASYVEGVTVDLEAGTMIAGANVVLESTPIDNDTSDGSGEFNLGSATPGTYTISASHPDYIDTTIVTTISAGEVSNIEIKMRKLPTYDFTAKVRSAVDGQAIPNASVSIISEIRSAELLTDENGEFTVELFEDTYQIYVGSWGHIEQGLTDQNPTQGIDLDVIFTLQPGFHDDFIVDQGWQVVAGADVGNWVREKPIGTFFNQGETAGNPSEDYPNDLGDHAYMTGNGEGFVGLYDVDGGITTLTSPSMDLTDYSEPVVWFDYWWVNAGGTTELDDAFAAILDDGTEQDTVFFVGPTSSEDLWKRYSFKVSDFTANFANLSLTFETFDLGNGHLVEAAVDVFRVTEGEVSSDKEVQENDFVLYPNPFTTNITIQTADDGDYKLTIYDVNGRLINQIKSKGQIHQMDTSTLLSGNYILEVSSNNGTNISKVIVKP